MVTKRGASRSLRPSSSSPKGAPDAKPKRLVELACKELRLDFGQVLLVGKERRSLYTTVQNEFMRRKVEKSEGEQGSEDQEEKRAR